MPNSELRWQCRRGMRELDVLLTRYLESSYEAAAADEKAAFRKLLTLADPDLVGYLLQKQVPDPDIAVVIDRILDRTDP